MHDNLIARPSSVKVVEVCRVAPLPSSTDSSIPSDQSLVTLFDLLWLRFLPVETVYIYEIPPTTNPHIFYDSILPKLKASLSLTLQHYFPLAGNLIWPQDSPKPVISFAQGDSVSLTIAESNADNFTYLSSNDFVDAKDYHPLIPPLEVSDERVAAMAIQITFFHNRGFTIGIIMHHAVLDGRIAFLFYKAWAHICKLGTGILSSSSSMSLPDKLKPFHDRMAIHDPDGLGELYANDYLNQEGPNNRSVTHRIPPKVFPQDLVRGTFEFTRANIQTLRDRVVKTTRVSDPSPLHLSTFSLGCAYTWICLVKAGEIKGEKTAMIFGVDVRSRLDPPVPDTYFGNCIVGRVAVAETKGLTGDDGLVVAVKAINEALKSLDDGVFSGAELWVSKFLDFSLYDKIYSIAGSQRFEVYGTDFGWGRPKKIELVSMDKTDAVSLMDSKNGGGAVEVGMALKKPQMEVFASLFAEGL
ncbi:malonyl-CoA:anthocyanidin 5-O-glucoside-6''-O-malonyltransferase-like [Argentina anserina]|uniref:malonyl-CoA:anthocyanidin 5-O-glucoside-6''-O-malonyltransferase-like n=1 Tax=Argentina anserina TaxID=57926 RepID=UPI00217666BA|nr:malonyl-CoA:anthocyanidin 5-O-glucoside-6''-O-malonyltransferase-like [Potentilla anserina]